MPKLIYFKAKIQCALDSVGYPRHEAIVFAFLLSGKEEKFGV